MIAGTLLCLCHFHRAVYPLIIAAATIVARYFISDPGCDINIAVSLHPSHEEAVSTDKDIRALRRWRARSIRDNFSNTERLFLELYT
jgi:hypothetical protein